MFLNKVYSLQEKDSVGSFLKAEAQLDQAQGCDEFVYMEIFFLNNCEFIANVKKLRDFTQKVKIDGFA